MAASHNNTAIFSGTNPTHITLYIYLFNLCRSINRIINKYGASGFGVILKLNGYLFIKSIL